MHFQFSQSDFERLNLALAPVLSGTQGEKALLVSCVDARYPHRFIDTMDQTFNLHGRYYHLALAGGSLGVTRAECRPAFLDNLGFAVAPEWGNVKTVIILNHRDCAAFRRWLKVTNHDPVAEENAHRADCESAIKIIINAHADLHKHVSSWLLPEEPPQPRPTRLANG